MQTKFSETTRCKNSIQSKGEQGQIGQLALSMTLPMDAKSGLRQGLTTNRAAGLSMTSPDDFTNGHHSWRGTKQSVAKQQYESSNGIETYTGNEKSRNSSMLSCQLEAEHPFNLTIGNKFKVGGQLDSAWEERKLGAQDKF
jgi:hypothetical protein